MQIVLFEFLSQEKVWRLCRFYTKLPASNYSYDLFYLIAALLFWLTFSPALMVSFRLLRYSLDPGKIRSQDSVAVINSIAHNPEGRIMAWEFVQQNYDLLFKRYGNLKPNRRKKCWGKRHGNWMKMHFSAVNGISHLLYDANVFFCSLYQDMVQVLLNSVVSSRLLQRTSTRRRN